MGLGVLDFGFGLALAWVWQKKQKKTTKVGDNNGQATHGARKQAWRTQAAWANKLRFCHQINRAEPHSRSTIGLSFETLQYSMQGLR